MKREIVGRIEKNGVGAASKRLWKCRNALKPYGILFPPFVCGTLNVRLDKQFPTPDYPGFIFISREKLAELDPGFPLREWWTFIPVERINRKEICAFIFRTETNYHGNQVIELVAHRIDDLADGQEITISL